MRSFRSLVLVPATLLCALVMASAASARHLLAPTVTTCDAAFSAPDACSFTPLDTYPSTSKWLDGVYVPPAYRGQPRIYKNLFPANFYLGGAGTQCGGTSNCANNRVQGCKPDPQNGGINGTSWWGQDLPWPNARCGNSQADYDSRSQICMRQSSTFWGCTVGPPLTCAAARNSSECGAVRPPDYPFEECKWDGRKCNAESTCFPMNAMIIRWSAHRQSPVKAAMRDLRVGDIVKVALSSGRTGWSHVSAIPHFEEKGSHPFVRVHTVTGTSITLTGMHYIMVATSNTSSYASAELVAARNLKVGNFVWQEGIAGQLEAVEIMTVEDIMDVGLAAPFTLAESVLVSDTAGPGIAASTFSEALDGVKGERAPKIQSKSALTFHAMYRWAPRFASWMHERRLMHPLVMDYMLPQLEKIQKGDLLNSKNWVVRVASQITWTAMVELPSRLISADGMRSWDQAAVAAAMAPSHANLSSYNGAMKADAKFINPMTCVNGQQCAAPVAFSLSSA